MREQILKMKEGEIIFIGGVEYMRIGSLLVNVADDTDVLMLGIDF